MTAILFCFVTAGCWDQQPLKDDNLVYGVAVDLLENQKLLSTAVVRTIKLGSTGAQNYQIDNLTITAKGETMRDMRMKIGRKLGGEYAANKARVILLGEKLAENNIYPILDILYRDPKNSLGAKLIIAKGKAGNILKLQSVNDTLIAEELLEIIESGEEATNTPKETVQSICPVMLDPGQDFALPYMYITKNNEVELSAIALFHNQKFTGITAKGAEATILLLMRNEMGKTARFTIKAYPKEKQYRNRFISIQTVKMKRNMKITPKKDGVIQVDLNLHLNVSVKEHPQGAVDTDSTLLKLNKLLSEQFTKKTKQAANLLQEANCDFLGIGRKLMAYHPETWKSLDKKNYYQHVQIKPKVKIKIVGHGILE
nr:Ger(x)C family spore germination protein [Bacillus sp. 165]